jgi:hypothetical protein
MTLPEISPSKKWTVTGVVVLPWPWPPRHPVLMSTRSLPEGTLSITIAPDSRIFVCVTEKTCITQVVSCEINQPQQSAINFFVIRDGNRLELLIGTDLVVSTVTEVSKEYTIPPNNPGPMYDFTQENDLAINRRRCTIAGTHPKPGRNRVQDRELFAALKGEIL